MIHMDLILQILDYLSTVLILLGIWGAVKNRRMWWIYSIGCGFLGTVAISKGLVGVMIGGVVSVILGVRNALYAEPEDKGRGVQL